MTAATQPKTRLAEILDQEGRKQSWLAKVTGLDTGMLSRYVNGLHVPDERRKAIAEALGRTEAEVFPETKAVA